MSVAWSPDAIRRCGKPQEIDRVAQQSRQIHADRGAVLFLRGDQAEDMRVVVFGQAKLFFTSPRGDEKVLEILGPGQSFGESAMFTPQSYPVSAQALPDSLVVFVHRDAIVSELERDPRLASRIITLLPRVGARHARGASVRSLGALRRDRDPAGA